jgi:amidase
MTMPSQDATANTNQAWAQIAANKRAALLASIPEEWIVPQKLLPPESQDDVTGWPEASGWFTAQELQITGLNATELLQKLASGELSSVDVTKAFCKRASAAQQLVCTTPFSCQLQHFED